jgi:hypothetical protein
MTTKAGAQIIKNVRLNETLNTDIGRAELTHGPKGPGPRVANFQGRHIKKIEIEVWYAGKKKGCPRERNLREIYTENTTMFCFLSVFNVVFAST